MAPCLTKPYVSNIDVRAQDAPPAGEHPEAARHVLIIGYGNTLRGDDGLGWIAADSLRARFADRRVTIMTCQQLTMDLSEALSRASLAILLDAQAGDQPGRIARCEIAPASVTSDSLHHHMPPQALLDYTAALYGRAPRMILLTIDGLTYDFGTGLSAAVEAALPHLLSEVEALVQAEIA